jgi:hypothetical protein
MEQSAFNFTAPPAGELFKNGSQKYKIYEQLLAGGITNVEIQKLGALSHTKRISEIRKALEPYLLDVEAVRLHGHVYLNKIKGLPTG